MKFNSQKHDLLIAQQEHIQDTKSYSHIILKHMKNKDIIKTMKLTMSTSNISFLFLTFVIITENFRKIAHPYIFYHQAFLFQSGFHCGWEVKIEETVGLEMSTSLGV